MTKLIELFEEAIYNDPYYTHGFIEVKEVEDSHLRDLEEMVTKIIKENGSDALIAFQRGVKHGKIDLLTPDFDFGEDIFVCLFRIEEYGVKEDCMGVFTKEQMEQYLEKHIERTIKQKIYGLLDKIQTVMENKGINEVNIELFEYPVDGITSLSIKTINGEMVAKFNYDSEEENHNFTVTKCNGEQKLDNLIEAYEVFNYAFKKDGWEKIVEPLKIWLKQNDK